MSQSFSNATDKSTVTLSHYNCIKCALSVCISTVFNRYQLCRRVPETGIYILSFKITNHPITHQKTLTSCFWMLIWVISKCRNKWPILLLRYEDSLDKRDLEAKSLFTVATKNKHKQVLPQEGHNLVDWVNINSPTKSCFLNLKTLNQPGKVRIIGLWW